ncbi:hypothetical protein SAMN05428949_6996 [Chitinophaga sp. YR627]|uniref:hypothetical protein n=1 Tax=Chitinophaga sp. YR627 TaxID=1881041 RepID=UPI0008ECD34E|nr:hypothetical protein [Chitinophaga sp. YR627]SFO95939.1 hypothetical protein SAMN05428949_6996 [Chitinophaga sp. YR627]
MKPILRFHSMEELITKEMEVVFEAARIGSPFDIDIVLFKMREAGFSQMEATALLIRKLKLSIFAADQLVVNSKTWEDKKESVMQLRDAFGDALKSIEGDNDTIPGS